MSNDRAISTLIKVGRLVVDCKTGNVYAPKSNTPKKPTGALTAKGYLRICIQCQGKITLAMVHRVVWIAANGVPKDSSFHVDHIDGDKTNNRLSNLELVSPQENSSRATKNGYYRNNGALNKKDACHDAKGRFVGKEVPA